MQSILQVQTLQECLQIQTVQTAVYAIQYLVVQIYFYTDKDSFILLQKIYMYMVLYGASSLSR